MAGADILASLLRHIDVDCTLYPSRFADPSFVGGLYRTGTATSGKKCLDLIARMRSDQGKPFF